MKLFGSSLSAHCFVCADYGITQARLEAELRHPTRRFRGYHTFSRIRLAQSDLISGTWDAHCDVSDFRRDRYHFVTTPPFSFLEVLERDNDYNDRHGARRIAILFLGADGIAAYNALFCQRNSPPPPFAVVVQVHGLGGNYDRFGRGGLLERIADRGGAIPRWLLVAENTVPWQGFVRVSDVDGEQGGMHSKLRFLHERFDVAG